MIEPALINLHQEYSLHQYSQEFHYYPFAVKLDKCIGICNTLNGLSNKVCIPIKDRRFKSKLAKHDYRYKRIKNTSEAFICGKVNHELRVTSYKFKSTSYEFKCTSYEFRSTSCDFKSTS